MLRIDYVHYLPLRLAAVAPTRFVKTFWMREQRIYVSIQRRYIRLDLDYHFYESQTWLITIISNSMGKLNQIRTTFIRFTLIINLYWGDN